MTAGTSWTIDTPYRETVAEARLPGRGVLCVGMEAAALFAVGQVRGVRVASAFAISDSLAELIWNPQFECPQVQEGMVAVYDAAVTALHEPAGGPLGRECCRLARRLPAVPASPLGGRGAGRAGQCPAHDGLEIARPPGICAMAAGDVDDPQARERRVQGRGLTQADESPHFLELPSAHRRLLR
jgi:hypothetical protein